MTDPDLPVVCHKGAELVARITSCDTGRRLLDALVPAGLVTVRHERTGEFWLRMQGEWRKSPSPGAAPPDPSTWPQLRSRADIDG